MDIDEKKEVTKETIVQFMYCIHKNDFSENNTAEALEAFEVDEVFREMVIGAVLMFKEYYQNQAKLN